MNPLQHYRDLCHKLDSLDDYQSAEADLIRKEMDAAWDKLTDAQKYILFTELGI